MYSVHYSDGTTVSGYETTQDALDAIDVAYPDYHAGHDGDLFDGGDRTLVWACEVDSINDDGRRAIASIRVAS